MKTSQTRRSSQVHKYVIQDNAGVFGGNSLILSLSSYASAAFNDGAQDVNTGK